MDDTRRARATLSLNIPFRMKESARELAGYRASYTGDAAARSAYLDALMGVGQRVARLGVARHRGLVALGDRNLPDGVGDVLAGLLHEQAGPGVGPAIGLGELHRVSQGLAVRVELGLHARGAENRGRALP